MKKTRLNPGYKLWLVAQTICSIILSLLLTFSSVIAISQADLEFFAANGIYYYNPSGVNCTASSTSGSNVTIIGDSITAGAADLGLFSKSLPSAKVYAKVSKQFGSGSDVAHAPNDDIGVTGGPTGISIAKYLINNHSLGSVVVFALGTNNSSLSESQINSAIELFGSSRTVFFVTNYDSSNPTRYDSNNTKLANAASKYSNVHIINWAAKVSADTSKYMPSGVHPNSEGSQLFVDLINEAVSGIANSGKSGSFTNYAGVSVFTDGQLAAYNANQPFYEAASQKVLSQYNYNLPWRILATLHFKEHGLQRDNPSNGQGAYQLYSYTRKPGTSTLDPEKAFLPAGAISDEEFQRQTDLVADLIVNSWGKGLDLTDANDIKLFFFKYNGVARQYIERAKAMGFTDAEANRGEGSTYVMNRYDAAREPGVGPLWVGTFVADGRWDPNVKPGSVFGAYTVYEAIGGDAGGNCSNELSAGGLTYEEAYALVETYAKNPSECSEWASTCNICDYFAANCVTFTQYFINKYTTAGLLGLPNGGDVVSNLINSHGFVDGGTTPRPYAIFSTRAARWGSMICDKVNNIRCGHTGVVLGINTADDEIYIGQMGCGNTVDWGLQHIKYPLSDFTSGEFTYAYTDNILK